MAAAPGGEQRHAGGKEQNASEGVKITQSHIRFLTMALEVPKKRGSIPDAPQLASSSPMSAEFQVIEFKIPQELAGLRLDTALSRLLPSIRAHASRAGSTPDRCRSGSSRPGPATW